MQEESAAPSAEQVRQAVESTQRSRGAQNLTESRGGEERTQSGRRFASEWAGNLPQVLTEDAYVRRLKELRVNPQATDSRTVTGTAYNKESGKLDVIVRGTDGKVETIPAAKAATTARQERLMELAADVGEAGPQMFAAIRDGQDVETYARQWKNAYTYGESNIPRAYAMQSDAVKYLTAEQRDIAYEAGKAAYGRKQAQAREKRAARGNDTTKAKKGTVKLSGAVIGGRRYDGVSKASLTERQRANLKVLGQVAQATGIDIVLYQSRANARGEYEGQNGAYKDGTLYLDINAGRNRVGDLSEVAVVRTAAHELTHFIQDYNPAAYAEYRDYVVGLLIEEQGMDFDALVEHKQALQNDLSYDEAVDEVVADGSEMLLRDTAAVQRLAEENRGLFQKIRSWLRKWLENIRKAFDGVGAEHAEAKALEQHLEELQKRWDDALVGASRNLQRSRAEAEDSGKTQYQIRQLDGKTTVVLDTQNDTRDYKAAETYLKTLVNTAKPFSTILTDALPVYIGKDLPSEYKGSEYTLGMNRALREVKMQAATNLDEMLLLAENGEWRENVKDKHRRDAQNGWYRYETQFAVPVLNAKKAVDHYTVYSGTLLIRNDADGKSYLYDMIDVEKKKVISSPSFSAQAHSDVFEPKPSQTQYTRGKGGSQAENSGKEQLSVRESAGRIVHPGNGESYWNDLSYRGYTEDSAIPNSIGYAMFADDPHAIANYGDKFSAVFHGDLAPIDDFKDAIARAWERDKAKYLLPSELEVFSDRSGAEMADHFDPADIVDGADAWDMPELITWAFSHGIFDEVGGVKTSDGAIVWDDSLIRGTSDDGGVWGGNLHEEKYSLRDSAGRELTAAQQDYFRDSQVRDADGNLLVMYHQTEGAFTVFDTRHKGAGTGDDETPFGIFLKRTARDIGVRGKNQMELYANIRNPLRVRDRAELVARLRELSGTYAELKDQSGKIDKEYGAKFAEAKAAFKNFLLQWRKENPDAPSRAAYDAEGFDAAFDAEDNVVKEWTQKKDELALRAKEAITDALRKNGYDGVILESDRGSWGRSTDAYIALDANQVKNVTNQNPTESADIRYSARDYGLTEDEEHAIVSYKSGDSYALNGKLATGGKLTEL